MSRFVEGGGFVRRYYPMRSFFTSYCTFLLKDGWMTGTGQWVCTLQSRSNTDVVSARVRYTRAELVPIFEPITLSVPIPSPVGVVSNAFLLSIRIGPKVRAAREFPEDLIRISVGIESAEDLISDLSRAMQSYVAPGPSSSASQSQSKAAATAK